MVAVRLDRVSKAYGASYAAQNVSLDIREGEFLTLLGASGSGKTTCLRIVGGFIEPSEGKVFFGPQDITSLPAHRRNTGMVFQQYALFPHMNVAANVAFGLKVRRLPRAEVDGRVREALRLVRLEAFAERYPSQLSGGQKQRVALARAVVINPKVLLLDEPLGALDLKLREELQSEIKRVQSTLGITAVFVTHDQSEALAMSDRIGVMRDGRLIQVDTPAAIYGRPASRYVASFVGRTNFLKVAVREADAANTRFLAASGDHLFTVEGGQGQAFVAGDAALLAFRPEDARLGDGPGNRLTVRAEKVVFLGDAWAVSAVTPEGVEIAIRVPPGGALPDPGEVVPVVWPPEHSLLLADAD
jgi:ABC-type Fe3+/spermidine/putrescine transport system ATPase subunit